MKNFFCGLLGSLFLVSLFLPQVLLAGANLQISAEPGVSIWLNGDLVGKTKSEENGLVIRDIAPGEYSLRAAKQGYNSTTVQLTAEEGQTIEWRIEMAKPVMKVEEAVKRVEAVMVEAKPVGSVLLKSVPLNAEIFLNGKSIGNADKKIIYAPASEHSVRFVLQQRELSEKFTLNSEENITLTADFIRGEIVKESAEASSSRGPAVIKMQTARARKPAIFPHRKHQEMYECAVCHHGMDDEGNQTPYTEGMAIQHCATCHNPDMENTKLNSLMQAAHTRCKGCHKKVVEESGTAGPIGKCSGCHSVPAEE